MAEASVLELIKRPFAGADLLGRKVGGGPPAYRYIVTAAAKADVGGIFRDTRRRAGDAQVLNYRPKLERGHSVLAGQCRFEDISATGPGRKDVKSSRLREK